MFGATRWSPFEELTTLHREMDRLFGRAYGESSGPAAGVFAPALEVLQGKDAWHVRVALPGVDPKNVQIDLAGDTVTIRGERSRTLPAGGDKSQAHLTEIAYGRFERTLSIPDAIESEKVSAAYNNGMLELTLPLRESVKPRRIEVKDTNAQKTLSAA
jgi:HSP20 family protein